MLDVRLSGPGRPFPDGARHTVPSHGPSEAISSRTSATRMTASTRFVQP